MPLLAVDESPLARISEEHWKQRSSMSARLAPIQPVGPEAAVNGVDLPHQIDGEPAGVKRFRLVQGRDHRRWGGQVRHDTTRIEGLCRFELSL
jgi:hypothetical protein